MQTSIGVLTTERILNINMLQRIQRQATKWILNDYQSLYRSRLITLHLLSLMYVYEMNDYYVLY